MKWFNTLPRKTYLKLTGTQGSSPLEKTNLVMPLYYVKYIREHLG